MYWGYAADGAYVGTDIEKDPTELRSCTRPSGSSASCDFTDIRNHCTMYTSNPSSSYPSAAQSDEDDLNATIISRPTSSLSTTRPTYLSRPPSSSRLVRSRHSYVNINGNNIEPPETGETSTASASASNLLVNTQPPEYGSRSRPPSPSPRMFLHPLPQDPDSRNLLPLSVGGSRSTTPVGGSTNASEAESEGGSGSDWRRRRKRTGSNANPNGIMHPNSNAYMGEGYAERRPHVDVSLNGLGQVATGGRDPAGPVGWFWGMAPATAERRSEGRLYPTSNNGLSPDYHGLGEKDGGQHSFTTTGSTSGTSSSSPSYGRHGMASYGVFPGTISTNDYADEDPDMDDPMASSTTHLFAPSSSPRRNSNQSQLSTASVAISSEMARHKRGIRQIGTWFKRKIGLGAAGMALAAAATAGAGRVSPSSSSSSSGAITLHTGLDGLASTAHGGDYKSVKRPRGRRKTRDSTGRIVPLLRSKRERRWWHFVLDYVPTSPLAITLSLCVIISFALGLTFTIKHILNPDKAPLPWRSYCTSQYPTYWALQFPPGHKAIYQTHTDEYDHDQVFATLPASAENLLVPINHTSPVWPFPASEHPPFSADSASLDVIEPVGVFIGVFSTDQARERRMMIRQTYGSHRKSRVPGTEAVRLRFVMGQPRPRYASAVNLEMDTFGDIVLLDIVENMNAGKTHAFFSWAAENATVPDLEWPTMPESAGGEEREEESARLDSEDMGDESRDTAAHESREKRALTIDDIRMAVQFHGGQETPSMDAFTDQAGALWKGGMSLWKDTHTAETAVPSHVHRPAGLSAPWYYESPVYKGERRPDYVVKADEDSFIMLGELERRLRATPRKMTAWGYLVKDAFMAGEAYALSFDLVRYIANAPALQALVHGKEDKLTARWLRMHPERESILWVSEKCWIYDHPKAGTVYSHGYLYPEAVDEIRRENVSALPPAVLKQRGGIAWADTYSTVSHWGTTYKPPFTDLTPAQAVEALVEGSEMSLVALKAASDAKVPPVAPKVPSIGGQVSVHGRNATSHEPDDVFSRRPTRQQRFKHDPMERGGTVVVHYIKRQDWFMETAMALLGNFEQFHMARAEEGGDSDE